MLKTYNFKHKVVMDGMALKANQIMSRHPAFLKDAEMFKRAIGEAEWIQGWSRRRRVVEEPCVIISPAGMLVGGSAIFYTQQIANSERMVLRCVHTEGTPGRMLLEKRVANFDGKIRKCYADVKRFEFSAIIVGVSFF